MLFFSSFITAAMSLDFHSLCAVASFLQHVDFKNFVSTCKAWSQCRHDVRTVAQVYVNSQGDYAPFEAAVDGCPVVRFFARQYPEKIFKMACKALFYGTEDAPALLKPFVPDEMVPALARRVIRESPEYLVTLMEHWDLDEKTRRDLMASLDREDSDHDDDDDVDDSDSDGDIHDSDSDVNDGTLADNNTIFIV